MPRTQLTAEWLRLFLAVAALAISLALGAALLLPDEDASAHRAWDEYPIDR